MILQRDCLPAGTILEGRYELKKVIYTTLVERNYEAYDRQKKKDCWIKEFYPSNYCNRGQDGQMVVLSAIQNQSVFEQRRESFEQMYRQIAAHEKREGLLEVQSLFLENNTVYVLMKKPQGELLDTKIRRAGGKLPYTETLPIFQALLQTISEFQKKQIYYPKITKDTIIIQKTYKKIEVIFGEISREKGDSDSVYSVASLWYEMLTGIKVGVSVRPPSELGVELPSEIEELLLCCLQEDSGECPSIEQILSLLPREKMCRYPFHIRQIVLALVALFFVVVAWISFLPKEEGELLAEEEFFTETASVETGLTLAGISSEVLKEECVSESAVNEKEENERLASAIPVTVSSGTIHEEKASKIKREKKKKVIPKQKEKKITNWKKKKRSAPYAPRKTEPPKSNLFDIW